MRRFFAFLLFLSLLFVGGCESNVISCPPERVETEEKSTESKQEIPIVDISETRGYLCNKNWDGKTLKVLWVGNSFSRNATRVLHQIATYEGVEEVTLGVLRIGGGTVKQHYQYSQNGKEDYLYLKNTKGTWEETNGVSLLYGLLDEEWDVITITQGPGSEGVPSAYDPYLKDLISYLNANKKNPDAQIGFHMTWAFPQKSTYDRFAVYGNSREKMFSAITSTAKDLYEKDIGIDFIIPTGTAVENARGLLGEIFTKDDGYHLNDYGDFVASYMSFLSLTGKPLSQLNYKANYITPSSRYKICLSINAALSDPFAFTEFEDVI